MDRYQDEFVPGGGEAGERDCQVRWGVIEGFIPTSGVLLDVGSNLGYFSLRATHENPELIALSLEADPAIADRQRLLIEQNANHRVTLLQGALSAAACDEWSRTCDAVDTTLLLAILHWIDDPARAVKALSSMSGRIVAEVPHPDDEGACGQTKLAEWTDPVAWFEKVTGRPTRLIGRMERHTSSVPSYVVVVEGPVRREPELPYWGSTYDHPKGRRYEILQDGSRTELTIRGEVQDHIGGINLVNLQHLGKLVWPPINVWEDWFKRALAEVPKHPDPLPHNALWTAQGLAMVDDEGGPILASPADGMRAFRSNLNGWAEGTTVGAGVVVRELTRFQRLRRTPLGRRLAETIPANWRQAVVGARRDAANRWRARAARGQDS